MLTSRILAFTVLVPGTVIGLVPWLMVRGQREPLVEWSDLRAWIGAAALVLGLLVYGHCAWEFGARGRGTPAPFDPPRQLVVTGLYRVVRNPMYLGVVTALFGAALLYRSTTVAAYSACMALVFHVWTIVYEEPKLRRLFGASFTEYCASVPRWIPVPWRA